MRIALLLRSLPEHSAFKRLSPTHQSELLPLRESPAIEQLARRALEDNLSARELRHRVRSEQRGSSAVLSHRERRQPSIIKATLAIAAIVRQERSQFTLVRIDELSEEDAAKALRAGQEALATLAELVEKLEVREAAAPAAAPVDE